MSTASNRRKPAHMKKEPLNIGSRRELFVDKYLIDESKGGVSLRLHEPRAQEIVLVTDRPWEGSVCGFVTVFRDGALFRMYYRAWSVELENSKGEHGSGLITGPMTVCYAESADGIHWERPDLGLIEFEGSTKNNIVWTGDGPDQRGSHGFSPFKDTNPACPPAQLYKAVGADLHATKGDLCAVCSSDGLHWSLMRDEPIFRQGVHGRFDSQNLAFWDGERCEYRVYFRDTIRCPEPGMPAYGCRAIKTAASKDFVTWSEPQFLAYPGSPVNRCG